MSESGDKARDRTLSGGSNSSEPDPDPHFEPIIRLPEVQVSTNEEDEDVLLKVRAKLYRFDTSKDEGPEWKERGTGELKMLRHKWNKTVRVVMRRDKTLKVCANHFITPFMHLKPSIGSDKAFVYNVPADFADETIKTEECLTVKFSNVEIANLFKDNFEDAKKFVASECSLYTDHLESKDASGSDEEGSKENVDDEGSKENVDEEESEENVDEASKMADELSKLNFSKEESDKVTKK